MNILGNNSSKLNEVIFENRNKNYTIMKVSEKEHKKQKVRRMFRYRCMHRHADTQTRVTLHIKPFSRFICKTNIPHSYAFTYIHENF